METINNITKADVHFIRNLRDIILMGNKDINPRPHWEDGTPAHTISVNHVINKYYLPIDSPIVTLRPIAYKNAIKEIFWIYQDASNDLDLLKDKYGITWWDKWDIGNRTIGCVYGETVRRHNLMNNLLNGLINDPDSRRHVMSLWQEDDFKNEYVLPPCCFQTIWNVDHIEDKNYLNMTLIQRSSDYILSGNINQLQYISLLYMVCGHLNTHTKNKYTPRLFTHYMVNQHIYDRHIEAAKKLAYERHPVRFEIGQEPHFEVEDKDFYDYTPEDIKIVGYPLDYIKQANPQIKFEVAI